jgi:hypothetical protein
MACYSYNQVQLSRDNARSYAGDVRVTRTNQRSVVLHHPIVVGDSLVSDANGSHAAIALADVQTLEERHLEGGRTALAVVGGVAAAVLVAVAIGSAGGGSGSGY